MNMTKKHTVTIEVEVEYTESRLISLADHMTPEEWEPGSIRSIYIGPKDITSEVLFQIPEQDLLQEIDNGQ